MAIINMSTKEIARLRIIQDLTEKRITPMVAARLLELSPRQVRNLRIRFSQSGPSGLTSRRRGKPSNRSYHPQFRQQVLQLVRTHYGDFGPTFACQKLRELHGFTVSVGTLRAWMKQDGLWQERRARQKAVHQPRRRRECLGELVQIDGSQHWWFEDRGPQCTLLVFIDDATSQLMQLRFVQSESAFAYFAATSDYLKKHGKPVAFYSDKHSIFRVPKKDAVGGTGMTQFGRVLHELNIDIICANTPQAKGRVERANRTLQDRLVKELRLSGICCMEEGNKLLPAFMDDYNARFGKAPYNSKNLHRSLLSDEDLERIFVWKEERSVSASLTLQYDKVLFMLEENDITRALVRQRVTVNDYPDGKIEITHNGMPLAYSIFDKVRQVDQAAVVDNKRLAAVLEHIQKEQAARPLYRSETAPRRTEQFNFLFQSGASISHKRRVRKTRTRRTVAPVPLTTPRKQKAENNAPWMSYEDQLCLEIGRRVREEQAKAHAEKRAARQRSRRAYERQLKDLQVERPVFVTDSNLARNAA